MNKLILFFLFTIPLSSWGQDFLTDEQLNQSGAIKLNFAERPEQARKLAREDIANKLPFLILHSGIAPIVFDSDMDFERAFGTYYYELGCTGPSNEISTAYNFRVLDYLTKNFGTAWKRKVRKDVVGLKKWKRQN